MLRIFSCAYCSLAFLLWRNVYLSFLPIFQLDFCFLGYWVPCCCSVAQVCSTIYDLMDDSTPGFPVLLHLPELAQTHVHWVSDVIQPSHSLSSPSPPALNPSQHQGLFKWVSFSHQAAKGLVSVSTSILPVNTQDWSTLGWTGWISLQSWQCVNVDLCENLLMITFTILIMRIGRFIMRSLKLSNIFGNSLASE